MYREISLPCIARYISSIFSSSDLRESTLPFSVLASLLLHEGENCQVDTVRSQINRCKFQDQVAIEGTSHLIGLVHLVLQLLLSASPLIYDLRFANNDYSIRYITLYFIAISVASQACQLPKPGLIIVFAAFTAAAAVKIQHTR